MAICLNAVKSDAGEKNIIMQIRLRVSYSSIAIIVALPNFLPIYCHLTDFV